MSKKIHNMVINITQHTTLLLCIAELPHRKFVPTNLLQPCFNLTKNDDLDVLDGCPSCPGPDLLMVWVHRGLPPLRGQEAAQLAEVRPTELRLQRSIPGRTCTITGVKDQTGYTNRAPIHIGVDLPGASPGSPVAQHVSRTNSHRTFDHLFKVHKSS